MVDETLSTRSPQRSAPTHTPHSVPAADRHASSPLDRAGVTTASRRGVTRAWRTLKGAPPAPLDDRGREVLRVEQATFVANMRESGLNVGRPYWTRILRWGLPALVIALILGSFVPALRPSIPLMLLPPVLTILIVTQSRRGENVPLALRERLTTASLLRAGRCAGCGFGLRGLEGPEGLVTCPECGAAWHCDRWRIEHDATDSLATRAIRYDFRMQNAADQVDDRGALLDAPMTPRPRWLKGAMADKSSPPTHLAPFLAARRAAMRQVISWVAIPLVLFLFAGVAIAITATTDLSAYLPVLIAFFLGFGIIIIVVMKHVGRAHVDVRTLALTHAVCPACGGSIDPAVPRDFDGCIMCKCCASAWRYDELRKPAARHRARATFSTIHSATSAQRDTAASR